MKQTCPFCKKVYQPDLSQQPDFEVKRRQWKGGMLIQKVWPEATTVEREQLMSGICSDKCWNKFLGPEE
jgi:hypothetical protein